MITILNLAREIVGTICKFLECEDAVSFGRAHKQIQSDLSKPDFGFVVSKSVPFRDIYDHINDYIHKLKYPIGHFIAFSVNHLVDIEHLPKHTKYVCFEINDLDKDTCDYCNKNIVFNLPSNITYIQFDSRFPLNSIIWPNSLIRVYFGRKFYLALNDKNDDDDNSDDILQLQNMDHLDHIANLGTTSISTFKDLQNTENLRVRDKYSKPSFSIPCYGTFLPCAVMDSDTLDEHIAKHFILPKSLKRLSFEQLCELDQPIQNILHDGIEYIEFSTYFNQKIHSNILPKSLKTIIFGEVFNQPIDDAHLPKSLQKIVFGKRFNQPLRYLNLLPLLKHLTFGNNFKQHDKNITFPASINYLEFENYRHQHIHDLISLRHLIIRQVNHVKNIKFPTFITHFTLGSDKSNGYHRSLVGMNLPDSVIHFTLGSSVNQ